MHLHTHLLDCSLDYGPIYSFWLFSFEHYNGILGEYGINQRSIKVQLMRKLCSDQFVKDIPLPSEFQEIFQPIFNRLTLKQAGTIQGQVSISCDGNTETDMPCANDLQAGLLLLGPVKKDDAWISSLSFSCCGPFQ